MKLTKREAIERSIELWEWLAETGERNKDEWEGWEKYGGWSEDGEPNITAGCFLCEYDDCAYDDESHFSEGCCACPYHQQFGNCYDPPSPFVAWSNAKTERARKKYARLFLAQLYELLAECDEGEPTPATGAITSTVGRYVETIPLNLGEEDC